MAEDDEIDILGDFSLDNFLIKNESGIYENASLVSQSNDLLNCDYTIHPQWLLDKPSANPDCWYDNTTGSVLSTNPEKPTDFGGNESEIGHVSTENAITDESGWTEKEKNLLERGIEIFGKSHVRLAQFIGSRTAAEVKYYLKNFYLESQSSSNTFNSGMVEDMNGVNNLVADILDDTQIPASIEEVIAAVSTAKPTIAVKQRKKTVSVNSVGDDFSEKKKSKIRKNVKFKIKAKLKFPMHHVKQKRIKVMNQENKKAELSRVEITTGKGLAVPICEGEEIVKISKDDTDSDIEIDVEEVEKPETKIKTEPKASKTENEVSNKPQKTLDISTLNDEVVKQLTNLDTPKCEKNFEFNVITELEKTIHCEFFEGRPTKTPLRYLKIRTHIINAWNSSKPNYVTKTSVRHSLKNCGDVNCISRIHCFLEQTGAINFGCPQTTYIRPLLDVFQSSYSNREKATKDGKRPSKGSDLASFSRMRRKLLNDGEGGRTLAHNEKGDVINTTIVNEDAIKPKSYFRKPVRLIYCRPFPPNNPQPITVKMNLTTLLLMDFHAHTSLSEVMGLIGGSWSPDKALLTVSGYEPCKNAASSATHCDMCPISQSKASDLIQKKGLDVLGWFHSHPTFAPEPSQQDLETQQNFQMMLGRRTPCLGVILSPFSSHGALIASPFRCLVVDKKENFEDQFVPYKLQVEIVSNEEIEEFLQEVKRMFGSFGGGKRIDFKKPYFQDNSISYLEKFITSVRMHLAKCDMNKMTCDYIISRVSKICTQ